MVDLCPGDGRGLYVGPLLYRGFCPLGLDGDVIFGFIRLVTWVKRPIFLDCWLFLISWFPFKFHPLGCIVQKVAHGKSCVYRFWVLGFGFWVVLGLW